VAAARHYGFSLESLVETEWAKFHAAPDVGTAHDGFNVRGTANPRGGLPIRQDDDEACPWPYLLVISFGDRWYHIMGWAFGPEIRKPHFWREDIPRPTWIMPQHALHDPVTLPVGAMT
jgi:hypothetical protein